MGGNRKKSNFPFKTSVDSGATFDFVYEGTNWSITDTDFYNSLGVTGTLVQSAAGTPVLDTAGTVNTIRNIEASVGLTAAVSAQNGVELKTALLPADTGVEILRNQTTAPQIRSITAGEGINAVVSGDGETIQISSAATPISTKTVTVGSMSDFPTPVAGVITLLPDTDYFVSADLTTADRFVLQDGTVLRGPDIVIGKLTYTGSGTMVTAVDATCKVSAIQMFCLSGTFASVSNSAGNEGTNTFIMDRIVIVANIGGVFTSLSGVQLLQSAPTFFTNGFSTVGTGWTNLNFDGFSLNQVAGTFIDLGTITLDRPLFNNFSMNLAPGSFGVSGLVDSGNINAGGVGIITIGRSAGGGDILQNITVDDPLWTFAHNDEIPDSRTDGLLSMQGNATNTVIAVTSTPVLVAGTWVIEETSRMTGTTGGMLTQDAGAAAKLPITSRVTIAPISGGNQTMSAYISLNGTPITNSKATGTASSGNPTSITIVWQEELDTTDFVEVYVANDTGTTDVLVTSAIHRVN